MNHFTSKKYAKLKGHFAQLEKVRRKNEKLFSSGVLNDADISQLYRGLFLDGHVSFESFIEEVFLGLLLKKNNTGHVAVPVFSVDSSKMARRLVFLKSKYLDWLPYSKTEVLAQIFFKNKGYPFSGPGCLDSSDKDFLNEELPVVRNVLSHDSHYAKQRFQELINEKYLFLSTNEKAPVNFIRHMYKRSPDTTLLEEYFNNMLKIAFKISK